VTGDEAAGGGGVDIGLAVGRIEVASGARQPGGVVVGVRPVSASAGGPGCEVEQLRGGLHGRWRLGAGR
jgi:hypothetical protein